ncbi:conserved uncharacterized protein, DUF3108 [Desulfosarcina variabilis str. Montpellier]|uniref:DUF3108 domain-containing protein n=1 Tax=Desulfosarcina variabilis TaxID=2300 RepID=UPI003AFB32EA
MQCPSPTVNRPFNPKRIQPIITQAICMGILVVALCLATISTGRASDPTILPVAFTPGERLTFELKWTIIPAGEAVLEILPLEHMAGRNAYHFVLTAKSNAFVDVFYMVRDRIDAWADTNLDQSLLYRKKQHEGDSRRDITVSFDWDEMTAQYINRGTNKREVGTPIPISSGTFDPLSIFYWCRSVDLAVNKQIQRAVTDGKKHIMGVAVIIRKETVTVPAGTFETFLLEPELSQVGGVFEKSPDASIQIWVTTDHRHLPIKLASKVVVGKFTGELTSMTGTALHNH